MTPVYSISSPKDFKPIPKDRITFQKIESQTELTITFQFTQNMPHFFAFTYPYTYEMCQSHLDSLEKRYHNHPSIYFHRELLTRSTEKRRIDLLTITSHKKKLAEREDSSEFPELRPQAFKKRYIFLSARVHPGEVPSSHCLNGVLEYILKPENSAILDEFCF